MNQHHWSDSGQLSHARAYASFSPDMATAWVPFENRAQAGRALAGQLQHLRMRGPLVVLALPRGGAPVAAEIARTLGAPLDLLLLRKIGAPFHPELSVATVVEGSPPEVVVNEETAELPGVDEAWIEAELPAALRELERSRSVYLGDRLRQQVQGATVIVVDDGITTGITMTAALRALRRRHPARLVVAVPVGPYAALMALREEADEVVCLITPRPFHAIALHFLEFHQLGDAEVCVALNATTATLRPS